MSIGRQTVTNQHELSTSPSPAAAAASAEPEHYQIMSNEPASNPTVVYDQLSIPTNAGSHDYYNVHTNRL